MDELLNEQDLDVDDAWALVQRSETLLEQLGPHIHFLQEQKDKIEAQSGRYLPEDAHHPGRVVLPVTRDLCAGFKAILQACQRLNVNVPFPRCHPDAPIESMMFAVYPAILGDF